MGWSVQVTIMLEWYPKSLPVEIREAILFFPKAEGDAAGFTHPCCSCGLCVRTAICTPPWRASFCLMLGLSDTDDRGYVGLWLFQLVSLVGWWLSLRAGANLCFCSQWCNDTSSKLIDGHLFRIVKFFEDYERIHHAAVEEMKKKKKFCATTSVIFCQPGIDIWIGQTCQRNSYCGCSLARQQGKEHCWPFHPCSFCRLQLHLPGHGSSTRDELFSCPSNWSSTYSHHSPNSLCLVWSLICRLVISESVFGLSLPSHMRRYLHLSSPSEGCS